MEKRGDFRDGESRADLEMDKVGEYKEDLEIVEPKFQPKEPITKPANYGEGISIANTRGVVRVKFID
jgi:hypothetical protein